MQVEISTEFIKLCQLLKLSGVAATGADAKDMVVSRMADVNGQICAMRGKKIFPGDRVKVYFGGETVEIGVAEKEA
jgi:ribosome-associated protein